MALNPINATEGQSEIVRSIPSADTYMAFAHKESFVQRVLTFLQLEFNFSNISSNSCYPWWETGYL